MSEPQKLTDEQLIEAVRRAADERLGPDEVEARVGERAWVNTRRGVERFTFMTANISADRESGQSKLPPPGEARDAAYWGRPLPADNPRIVGIMWDEEGSPEIFFGVLYPP